MNNNKNISKPNIGENLSPHKYQSSVVNISKPLEEQIETIITEAVESQMDYDEWTSGRCEDVEDKIMSLINQAILNERTKTLEIVDGMRKEQLYEKYTTQNGYGTREVPEIAGYNKALKDLKGKLNDK